MEKPNEPTPETSAPKENRPTELKSIAELVLLRERSRREQEARAKAQERADAALQQAIEQQTSPRPRPTTQRTAPEPVPAALLALRTAARLRPLDSDFWRASQRCFDDRARQLGERYSPQRVGLDKYHVYDDSGQQAAVLKRVREFVADMENVLRETRGLILFGSVGTGKDFLLATALYRVATAAIPAAFVSGEDLYLTVRDSMDTGEREEKIIRQWTGPVVLGVSDPVSPHGELKEWDARILARLLDRRYRALRPTWLTMNATDEDDAKSKLTSLIWDRFRDGAEIVHCYWPSFRDRRNKPASARPIAGKITAAS